MAKRTKRKRNSRKRGNGTLPGFLALSVAIVLAAALLSRRSPSVEAEMGRETIVAEYDTVMVSVPMAQVPAGTKLSEVRMRKVPFPRHQLPSGAITEIGPFSDRVTITALPANLPVFEKNLSKTAGALNPVIERIPEGMRAMTIKVDATSAVEGWAGSGAVVDVLLIANDQTSVVAEKVKILSAERSVSPVEGSATPNVPSTVTLLVTQEQCLAINTAIPLGKIAFALRSFQDHGAWSERLYTADSLKRGPGIGPGQPSKVKGYIAISGEEGETAYALADGSWVRSETVPEGFFAAQNKK